MISLSINQICTLSVQVYNKITIGKVFAINYTKVTILRRNILLLLGMDI